MSELPEDAVEAAAKALYADSGGILEDRWTYCIPQAERVLAAAVPFLERAVRDKIAAEIAAEIAGKIAGWEWRSSSQYIRGMRAALLFVTGEAHEPLVARGGEATE